MGGSTFANAIIHIVFFNRIVANANLFYNNNKITDRLDWNSKAYLTVGRNALNNLLLVSTNTSESHTSFHSDAFYRTWENLWDSIAVFTWGRS